jgi:hypothetical protein
MPPTNRKNGSKTGRDNAGRFSEGNPGKPKGSRHKATQAAQALLDDETEALTRAAIERALAGDATALRLCLERICPPRKDAPVQFTLPTMNSAADAAQAAGAIVQAVADGDLTPIEAAGVMGLIDSYRRTLETTEIEQRISALEAI